MDISLITEGVECIGNEVTTTKLKDDNFVITEKKLILNPDETVERYLKFLHRKDGSISEMAVLSGDILPTKCGYTSDNRMWVTIYGGMTLTEDDKVPNNEGYKIKKIHYSDDSEKYIIELIKL